MGRGRKNVVPQSLCTVTYPSGGHGPSDTKAAGAEDSGEFHILHIATAPPRLAQASVPANQLPRAAGVITSSAAPSSRNR